MSGERLFFVIWGAGVLLTWPPWIWWSVRSRRVSGYPLVPKIPAGSIYAERRASGRQQGKFGGASNCLLLAVTEDVFLIAPAFPFNLIAPRSMFGLEYTVPRNRITVTPQRTWLGSNVRVELRDGDQHVAMDLKLGNLDAFIEAVGRGRSL